MRTVIKCSDAKLFQLLRDNGFRVIPNRPDQFRRKIDPNEFPYYPRFHLIIQKMPHRLKMLDLHIDFKPHVHYTNNHILIAEMLKEFENY